jgi:hypothetical protein
MKTLHFVVLLVGLFVAALIFIHMKRGVDAMDRMELGLALNWTFTAVGGALAAISAFLILNRAIAGTTLEQILPLVVAFAGGLLLYQNHWATAVALAAILISWSLNHCLRPPKGTKADDNSAT